MARGELQAVGPQDPCSFRELDKGEPGLALDFKADSSPGIHVGLSGLKAGGHPS